MNEEEKKAIEELEEFIKGPCETCKYCEAAYKLNRENIIQLLNLTKKLQKENEELNYKLHSKKIALEIYNRYIPKSKVEEKIEEIQKEYEETLKTANFKEIEKMNKINFRGITLEGQRSILRELLENRR